MTGSRTSKGLALSGISALVSALLLACALAVPAYAQELNAPTQVGDDITRLQVEKLEGTKDSGTHEPVIGATMVIVDADGNTVAEWVSDGSAFTIEKGLDVGVVYTLKELNAPEGYSKISPISFTVDPIEGNGITINSGDESQYDLRMEFSSLAEGVHNNLVLYDKRGTTENVIEVKEPGSSKTVSPKTGDETPLTVGAGIILGGLVLIVLLQFAKSRIPEN